MIRTVIIAVFIFTASVKAQVVLLTGRVFENNAAVVGQADVVLQHTSIRTVTDDEGNFTLEGVIGEETPVNHPETGDGQSFRLQENIVCIIVYNKGQKAEITLHSLQGRQVSTLFKGNLIRGVHEFTMPVLKTKQALLTVTLGTQVRVYRLIMTGGRIYLSRIHGNHGPESGVLMKMHQTEEPESLVVSKEGYITTIFPLNQTWSWPREIVYEDDLEIIILFPVSGNDLYGDSRPSCVDRINGFRETVGLPPLERWTEQEMCVDAESFLDSESGRAHGAFGNCQEGAQNECPGWNSVDQVIQGCIQSMWNEGPGPEGCADDPQCYMEHGHYINMTSTSITKVACGFYKTTGGKVWAIQNFR